MRRDLNSAGWFEVEGGAKEGKCNWEPQKSQRGSELLSMFCFFNSNWLFCLVELKVVCVTFLCFCHRSPLLQYIKTDRKAYYYGPGPWAYRPTAKQVLIWLYFEPCVVGQLCVPWYWCILISHEIRRDSHNSVSCWFLRIVIESRNRLSIGLKCFFNLRDLFITIPDYVLWNALSHPPSLTNEPFYVSARLASVREAECLKNSVAL